MAIQRLRTVFSTGAWVNNVKTFFTKINEIIDYLNGVAGEGSYIEYRALLTQTGTNAPIEDDLMFSGAGEPFVDTINGVWSYNNSGSYYYTKVGAFSNVKKVEVIFGSNTLNQSPTVLVGAYIVNDDTLEIQSFEASSFGSFPLVGSNADDLLSLQPITIRIYN